MINSLKTSEWGTFKICQLFDIAKGKRLIKEDMTKGTTPFVAAISDNNGIRDYIDAKPDFDANKITVNYNGSVGEAFFQEIPFCASDDVNVLTLKQGQLTKNSALFVCSVIKANKFRFSYGRKWKLELMEKQLIKLPVKNDGSPDWEGMDAFMASLGIDEITTKISIAKTMSEQKSFLDSTHWKAFRIKDLFSLKNGIKYPAEWRESGSLPLVSTSALNNGISDCIKDRPEKYSNILTVAYSGSVGATFYQEKEVFVGETVFALLPKFQLNKYIGLFLATVISKNNERYAYGNKIIGRKYIYDEIKLPIDESGKPDWKGMENFIKALPYSDRI